MNRHLRYILTSGKNSKFNYYLLNYLRLLVPNCIYRHCRERLLQSIAQRPDKAYIEQRINYYNRLTAPTKLPDGCNRLCDEKIGKKGKVYYFDSREITRYFSQNYHWNICPGDVTFVPEMPSIVKSRPLIEGNQNSILLKMDKVRHFIFVNDKKSFADKKDMAIFRGKVKGKESRRQFMRMYFGNPMCDCGDVSTNTTDPVAWQTEKMTIAEHLDYKFIMALEGNDVASNLKWVMSSNSVAVMPRPTCETWFMEGTLVPNYHYIEIKADFSDLEERLRYYIAHPAEAEAIVQHAHEYIDQFRDKKRERLIAIGVLDKYFRMTGQQ